MLLDNRTLVARDVQTTASSFAVGPARTLFRVDNAHPSAGSNVYEVTRDGRRFLFNVRRPAAPDPGTTVVLHWTAGLQGTAR